MAQSKLTDLARMLTATTGQGPLLLTAAVASFRSFAQAGIQSANTVSYAIDDGNNREVGRGVYTEGTPPTLTRTVLTSTNGNNPIALSGNAQVAISAGADDLTLTADKIVAASPPYLPLTGGTIDGSLTAPGIQVFGHDDPTSLASLADNSVWLDSRFNVKANVLRGIFIGDVWHAQWEIALPNEQPRVGSNTGADLSINRFADPGNVLHGAATVEPTLTIMRSNGSVRVTRNLSSNATSSATVIGDMGSYGGGISVDSGYGNILGSGGMYAGVNCYVTGVLRWRTVDDGNFYLTANGGKPGGGNWFDSSDARIKTVHGAYTAGLAAIRRLNPIRYTFKGNDSELHTADGIERIGLIAQEVENVVPECVTRKAGKIDGEDVTDLRVLDTGPLLHVAINALKELTARAEALRAQLDVLRARRQAR